MNLLRSMKALILTLIGLGIIFAISCRCPISPPQPEPPAPSPPPSVSSSEFAEQLAKRFCPIIHLKGEGDVTENYEPTQIEILIDQSYIRDVNNPSFQEKASLSSLLQWSKSEYYLDLAGIGPSTKSFNDYMRSYIEIRDLYKPTIYARIIEQLEEGYTVLQYWLFYYFNDWRNYHEGDWELVQLNFPGKTAKEILEAGQEPISSAYSQHQAGQQMPWSRMKEAGLVEDTHPVVYVARGSHANYFIPGNFWAGLDFDDTGLSSWQTFRPGQLNIVLLPVPGATEKEFEWLDFKGYWGEYLDFSVSLLGLRFWQHGPFGPPWKEGESNDEKWKQPDKWSNELPEFPKPFWTSFFSMLGDWTKLAVFSLFSPADLHIYDSQGRHVGLDEQGQPEIQIPGAIYITPEGTDYKTIIIPDADISNEYRILAKGIEQGKMDIRAQIPDIQTKLKRFLEYLDVPISPRTVARAIIKPELLGMMRVPLPAKAEGGTTRDIVTRLEIDSDGDGIFELESAPGKFTKQEATPAEPQKPAIVPAPVIPPASDIEPQITTPSVPKNKELELIPLADYYLIKVIGGKQTRDSYLAEINPEFDPTFNERLVLEIKYPANYEGLKIGEPYYFEGETRTPDVIGKYFQVKGIIWRSEGTIEIIKLKQNVYYESAFRYYRNARYTIAVGEKLSQEANAKYDAIFDTLPEGKCVYHTKISVPLPPSVSIPSDRWPASPELAAQDTEKELHNIENKVELIKPVVTEIDELVISDCNEELQDMQEYRDKPNSIPTQIESLLEDAHGSLSRIIEILDHVMEP